MGEFDAWPSVAKMLVLAFGQGEDVDCIEELERLMEHLVALWDGMVETQIGLLLVGIEEHSRDEGAIAVVDDEACRKERFSQ